VPGTVLLEIVDRSVDAELGVVESSLNAIQIRKARLNAERALSHSISFSTDRDEGSEIAAIIASERQSFQANRAMLNTQLQLIDSQKADARPEILGLKREVTQIKSAYDLLNNEIGNAERLVAKNYMAKNTLSTLRREAADYRAQLENRRTGISRAKKKINSLNVRKQEARANYVNLASQALTELENEERRLTEQRAPLEDAVVRQNVIARVAGTVLAMESIHPGSVLPPGGRILDIVPSQDQLMIGARVAISDIDEIHSGQSADIRFNAFPARQTPIVMGIVNHVSADRLIDESTGQSYFTVEVSVDKQSLLAANLPPLHPGMSANVFLKTQKRTVLDYLLNPVITFHEKSMRES
jgi:HlyD family type I secretion membrane fusion protein